MLWKLGAGLPLLLGSRPAHALVAASQAGNSKLSAEDDAFLEELERATFLFFADCAHPETGLVRTAITSQARITGKSPASRPPDSG